MKYHPFATLALAAVIALPALSPVPDATAAPPAPTLLRTVRVKVDGDKSLDTVRLFSLSRRSYLLQVTTSKTTSSVGFTSDVDNEGDNTEDVWYGTAGLDGTKGAEIIVRRFNAQAREDGVASTILGVYTWRKGKLVAEKAPVAASTKTWRISGRSETWRGYHFFNRSGRRYVDTLVASGRGKWTAIRSVWSRGHWARISKRKVKLSNSQANKLFEISGAPVLMSQFSSDIDGDGAADHFTYRRSDHSHFLVSITTARGKKLSKKVVVDDANPLLGAAHLDGVAGTELAFVTEGELPIWEVYTWRNGKLVGAKSPSLTGEKPREDPGEWSDGDSDDTDSLAFSVVNGVATVESVSAYNESNVEPCYFVVTSQWRAGAWVKTAESDPCLTSVTPEFHQGIIADFVN